ncbi:hypothetical protein [Janthinobacterium fluminis]|uniref:Transporter n=1 Tax=Janthinobacterium fluminis TaxID=2987524 RepID=A0ABT5K6E4_9BURK|nr:hypothetical protein [Janthinobacterium fluminis]MDC8759973.1 hypothetical protein [Janthinobacterium fluminis]
MQTVGALALTLALAAPDVRAARPMTVDDASILPAGGCQLETWAQRTDGRAELWAVPACNFGGDWELALGASRAAGAAAPGAVQMQAKTVFRALARDDWGVGLVLANQFRRGAGPAGDLSANVPLSVSLRGDALLLHANLGWLREYDGRRHAVSWGLAAETALGARSTLSAELFGQHRGRPHIQLGLRHYLVPERLQIDAAFGERFGRHNKETVFSIGLVLSSDTFLH